MYKTVWLAAWSVVEYFDRLKKRSGNCISYILLIGLFGKEFLGDKGATHCFLICKSLNADPDLKTGTIWPFLGCP